MDLDTTTFQGGAELPLCPDFTAREQSPAGGNANRNIAELVLAEVWAERLRPTLGIVACAIADLSLKGFMRKCVQNFFGQ